MRQSWSKNERQEHPQRTQTKREEERDIQLEPTMGSQDEGKDKATDPGSRRAKRQQRRRDNAVAANKQPTQIVCTKSALYSTKNSVELGAVVSMGIVALYLFGCLGSLVHVPSIHTGRIIGANLNVPVLQRDEDMLFALQEGTVTLGDRGLSGIPTAVWPVSLRDEGEDRVETIPHPADDNVQLTVPRFWSKPLHNNKLFTREQAMAVGSCATPDPNTGSFVRGTDCPADQRTIFVAIASYRDFQCRQTVESIFTRASNPDRIRIGVVDQIVAGEDPVCNEPMRPCEEAPQQALCKYQDQVDVFQMEAQLSVGPVFARHIGHRMYRGEYYSTQSDAHVTYTKDWDKDIIDQMEQSHNEMAVLTTYLTDVQGSISPEGRSLRKTRPIMCNTYYEGGVQGMHLRHGSQPERFPSIRGSPQLAPWWAAGYSFSRGHFVVNVPYDQYQPMIFQGEEMSIGIRGYTIGYDFYAPERSVCFHHYAVGKNAAVRNKVKHFWENGDRYKGVGKKAMARLLGIVHMNPETPRSSWDHKEEDMYGIGAVREPEQFYKIFGINVVDKETQGHLCKFVDDNGRMHKEFTKYLRQDGMGIDYTNIHSEWVDPTPNEKHFK